MIKGRVVAILGPTAGGKARLTWEAARATGAHLVSCDSMKVYRGMDIGTAKPPQEQRAHWHGVDLVWPWESWSASRFHELWESLLEQARAEGRPILLSGGTALYLKAVTEGLCEAPPRDEAIRSALEAEARQKGSHSLHARLRQVDPAAAERIHENDERRLVRALEVFQLSGRPLSSFQTQFGQPRADLDLTVFAVTRERHDMQARINLRVDHMLERGWLEECRQLLADPRGVSNEAAQALGYRELFRWIRDGEGESWEEVIRRIKRDTRRFARRQLTWLGNLTTVRLPVAPGEEALEVHKATLIRALEGEDSA